jgi:hypothetical protein
MGTSFGWGDEPAAPVSRAANNGYNESPIKMAPNPAHAYSSPQKQHQFEQSSSAIGSPYGQDRANNAGFGDTGNSSIRLHAPSGGGNAMGTSFGWDGAAGGGSPSVSTPSSRNQTRDQPRAVQTSSSMKLAVGTHVLYKQIGKSGVESPAVIIDIEPVGSRYHFLAFSVASFACLAFARAAGHNLRGLVFSSCLTSRRVMVYLLADCWCGMAARTTTAFASRTGANAILVRTS